MYTSETGWLEKKVSNDNFQERIATASSDTLVSYRHASAQSVSNDSAETGWLEKKVSNDNSQERIATASSDTLVSYRHASAQSVSNESGTNCYRSRYCLTIVNL
jgi:hypothetical protein